MSDQLSEHPLAELIREVSVARLSGALRLQRERVKVVIYFAKGDLYYATSNLRGHRLTEVLKRAGIVSESLLNEIGLKKSDAELETELLRRRTATTETMQKAMTAQVTEILRTALSWTVGSWSFDPRARPVEEINVKVPLSQLLLEAGRLLSEDFVALRLNQSNETFSQASIDMNGAALSPVEAFVLSRVQEPIALTQLTALSGVAESEALRAIYTLSLSGLIERRAWPIAISPMSARQDKTFAKTVESKSVATGTTSAQTEKVEDEERDLTAFFARLSRADDYFEVLDVARSAGISEIKDAYHALARRFHPDRFHQSQALLRARVDSAFARIAQAYETLSDQSLREAYEAKLKAHSDRMGAGKPESPEATQSGDERARVIFQKGLTALKQNQRDEAISCFAEAVHFAPREARYRAQYGQILATDRATRRLAETELQAAISLEPNNASYHIMLGEFYQDLGLRRRALGEFERALIIDPKNKNARAKLERLQKKA
jgi:curved DNA-binding protein CbpA